MIGTTISHYTILEKLGEGGMGVVYKAHDTKLDRDVALKFLPHYLTSDPNEKERFHHEARAAAALTHANIAVVYEIGEHENQVYIAMEYVEGKTLRHQLEIGPLPTKKVIDIAIQVCEGLAAAHDKGIVHRDIKSENIILTPKGQAKIMDFGLAKVKGATKLTRAGSTLGTAAYMSPEQAQGEEVDHRSDIFSFGVVLYELLTGRLPFRGEHYAALVYSILSEDPQPVARFNEKVTPELEHIVSKALAKDKEERYQHADELLADLKHERKRAEQRKGVHVSGTAPSIATGREYWYGVLLIGAGIIALIAVLALIFNPFKQHPGRPEVAGTEEKSIAVLPFTDMSPNKDQEYFCDGMTDELINRLSHLHGLKVPARTSVFTFKGKTYEIKDVGEKLRVQSVLEGSVQKSGNQLRVIAQLINVRDGYHIWSEKYDSELNNVFSIQDEIASAIVNALRLTLTPLESQKLSEHPIDNVKAYEYYLKADREVMRFDERSLDSAIVHLQTALDIMGDNAELYSGLALVYLQYGNTGLRQEDYFKKAEEYARRALSLRPDLPSALCALGMLAFYEDYPKNITDAYTYYTRVLAANSAEIRGLHGMENIFGCLGIYPMGDTLVQRIERQDPLNPRRYIMRGFHALYNCKFGTALEQFRLLYQIDSTSPLAQTVYSWALASNGMRHEALEVTSRIEKGNPKNVMSGFTLLLKYALLNDRENALRLITPDFRKTCWRDAEWSYWVAHRLALAGARKESLDWLENAINHGFINYPFMQYDPFLENLRSESRFKTILEHARSEREHFELPKLPEN